MTVPVIPVLDTSQIESDLSNDWEKQDFQSNGKWLQQYMIGSDKPPI